MMIEQILCGVAERWSQTRNFVPLTPLRGSGMSTYGTDCTIDERVHCSPPSPTE
jgi:hypothetical protein